MKMNTFTESIYFGTPQSDNVAEESPYQTWLRLTTEKVLLQFWLQKNLPSFALSKETHRPIRILDLGCGFGHMAIRLLRVLLNMGLRVDYTGVDPYQAQLDLFKETLSPLKEVRVRLIQGDASTHIPDQVYDLIFASHMLYYVDDWMEALRRIIDSGREGIIVHHGARGINTIHERFRKDVHPGPHVISTDNQVANILRSLPLQGRRMSHHRFPSTVAVRLCQLPRSRAGNNLLSFFLEHPLQEIPSRTLKEIRTFMRELYDPDHLMVHDVGVITIR